MRFRSIFFIVLIFALATASLSACAGTGSQNDPITFAPKSMLPDFARDASRQVQEAYLFAAANPNVLRQYPCYCGCGGMGHTSNLDCYVKEFRTDGTVEFDNHAFGCSICVDITQDVMRLMREGKDETTIRDYINTTYSPFGPSTDTPPVGQATCSEAAAASCGKTDTTPLFNSDSVPQANVPTNSQ